MNCAQFRTKISPYLDKELTFRETEAFGSHRSQCSDCNGQVTAMEQTRLTLATPPLATLSPHFLVNLQQRIQAEMTRDSRWWKRIWEPWAGGFSPLAMGGMAAATVAVLVIGMSLFLLDPVPLVDPAAFTPDRSAPGVYATPSPMLRPLVQPPLTSVVPDSSLKVDSLPQRDFSKSIRLVNQEDKRP